MKDESKNKAKKRKLRSTLFHITTLITDYQVEDW